jgi:hypothetical protein
VVRENGERNSETMGGGVYIIMSTIKGRGGCVRTTSILTESEITFGYIQLATDNASSYPLSYSFPTWDHLVVKNE